MNWEQRTVSVCTSDTRTGLGLTAVGLAFAAIACSPNGPDITVLERPQWECPTPPTVVAESGTGAHPDDNSVHLRWIIGDDPDLEGYYVYRRVHPETFDTLYAAVTLAPEELAKPGQALEWVDKGSVVGTLYYYVLFAFDRKGNRSPRSDTVGYQLLPKADLYEPLPKDPVIDPRPRFRFTPSESGSIDLHTFVVRVVADSAERSRVLWVSPYLNPAGFSPGEKTEAQYGNGGIVVQPTLPTGKYRWRVDAQGISRTAIEAPCRCVFGPTGCPGTDTSLPTPDELSFFGSKSAWKSFTVVR